ncbi:MAG TPA: ribonuclease HIII [Planctomycetota bacterium]|nr:ribonuclease HIII [Planctomycetota bacterium]
MGATVVLKLDAARGARLKVALEEAGFAEHPTAYADFGFKGEGVTAVRYTSGKFVVQGKDAKAFVDKWLPDLAEKPPQMAEAMIGGDESGKGDYFGPLVTAACALTPEILQFLDEVPLRDSKTLSTRDISEAAETLRRVLPHEIVVIGPRKYNQLYESFGNLNRLLAWAHATAIRKVVEKSGVKKVLLDKFCDESVVRRALGETAATLDFRMEVRAESSCPAVAAASILARDAFVRSLRALEREFDCKLPLGAGPPVIKALQALVATKGRGILPDVAKTHFKTGESA